MAELQQAHIVSPTRIEILDLLKYGYPFQKVEGLVVVGNTLSVADDNNFDVAGTDATQVWTFHISTNALYGK
ncbi:MAG TPA: hypothetical protein VGN34_06585 [Ktedonobacteraceae bacterium]